MYASELACEAKNERICDEIRTSESLHKYKFQCYLVSSAMIYQANFSMTININDFCAKSYDCARI